VNWLATRSFVFVVALICILDNDLRAQPAEQQALASIERLGGSVYRDTNNEVDIVSLEGTGATDSDLALLEVFPKLRVLDLDGTAITDAGLQQLLKLPALEEVSLKKTKVTKAAALEFKEQHPGVYHVDLSPGIRPAKALLAGIFLIPILFGSWLILLTQRKKAVLSTRLYARGVGIGWLLIVVSLILMTVAIMQSMGIEFHLADLFG